MNHRIRELVKSARSDGPRIGLLSMYDVENNAVRILAATLRAAGHHVTEIYFKDWVSNHIFPPTEEELESLILGTFDATKEKITKEEEEELARQEAAAAAAAAALEESKQGASPAKKATPPVLAVETPTRAVRSSPTLPEPGPAALRFASQR